MTTNPQSLGGGPWNGYSPQQTIGNYKTNEQTIARRILVKSWNTQFTGDSVNGYGRVVTPFRAITNSGDFLQRQYYVCGGSNQVNASKPGWKSAIGSIISQCDSTGIQSATCNVKYVADSSDYIRFKKLRAQNQNFNDLKNGGDQNNASYVPRMAVRRA